MLYFTSYVIFAVLFNMLALDGFLVAEATFKNKSVISSFTIQ